MKDQEKVQIETLFKEEIKKKLNTTVLYSFLSSLEVLPNRISDLDRWRKVK